MDLDAHSHPDSPKQRQSSPILRIVGNLAIAGLGMCATSVDWTHLGPQGWTTYKTAIGESRSVPLSDGSVVLLNTNSEMQVSLGPGRRDIRLIRGEGLFRAAHNAYWPFDVTAEGVTVRAVGTAFDVRITEDHEWQLAVSEGRVRVGDSREFGPEGLNDSSPLPIVEADALAVARAGIILVRPHRKAEIVRKLAWTQGEIVLNGETLSGLVHEINRYNRDKIEVDDPSIGQRTIGGSISPKNLDGFFAILQQLNISVVESGKTLDGATVFSLCGRTAASSRCSNKKDYRVIPFNKNSGR